MIDNSFFFEGDKQQFKHSFFFFFNSHSTGWKIILTNLIINSGPLSIKFQGDH